MIGIDLFSGAGGMSLGARLAGITVKLAVEPESNAAATYRRNHPETQVLEKSVSELSYEDLPSLRHPEQKVLFGGPPCQGFSYSNQKTRSTSNQDNWLFREFLRIVGLWKPEWVVFENVQGIVNTAAGIFFDLIITSLHKMGYWIAHGVRNSYDFGVPQRRSRCFIIGSKLCETIELPLANGRHRVTVRDAIADLPALENGAGDSWLPYEGGIESDYALRMRSNLHKSSNHLVSRNAAYVVERYAYVPEGGNWEDIPIRLMRNYSNRNRCHTGIYRRLRWDEPSVVIGNYRKNMLIHPGQDRGLSVREAARLQSFPDWYIFEGTIGFQQQQVADAVPPLLAAAILSEITRSGRS